MDIQGLFSHMYDVGQLNQSDSVLLRVLIQRLGDLPIERDAVAGMSDNGGQPSRAGQPDGGNQET